MRLSTSAVNTATRWSAVVAGGGFVLWLIVALQLFVNVPPADKQHSDAVIMLGGLSADRLPAARGLQDELDIPVLVLAETGLAGNASADDACDAARLPSADLVCFRPDPLNTRGEAMAIERLVKLNHWKSVTVVTSDFHATRAGTLVRQCTDAEVHMVPAPASMGPGDWLWRFVVETGGLLDATVRPQC
ncbi:YdcF family protein [Arthrobacter sp. ZBG10]|uniref:YdcF family protein n=1 Tax=Arthrobacter sp. ZBG10 TaxID=1676590 RepID=UPI001E504E83|nr:ElyC/SanA/YdcF family protein [Arthrobacter sp. ZBG10]